MSRYKVTLIHEDGRLIGKGTIPMPTRYIHLVEGNDNEFAVELSDDPPADEDRHLDSFARVATPVWVDTDKFALYVRMMK